MKFEPEVARNLSTIVPLTIHKKGNAISRRPFPVSNNQRGDAGQTRKLRRGRYRSSTGFQLSNGCTKRCTRDNSLPNRAVPGATYPGAESVCQVAPLDSRGCRRPPKRNQTAETIPSARRVSHRRPRESNSQDLATPPQLTRQVCRTSLERRRGERRPHRELSQTRGRDRGRSYPEYRIPLEPAGQRGSCPPRNCLYIKLVPQARFYCF